MLRRFEDCCSSESGPLAGHHLDSYSRYGAGFWGACGGSTAARLATHIGRLTGVALGLNTGIDRRRFTVQAANSLITTSICFFTAYISHIERLASGLSNYGRKGFPIEQYNAIRCLMHRRRCYHGLRCQSFPTMSPEQCEGDCYI